MAARSLGCGRRLLDILHWRAGLRGWLPRRAASGPPGSTAASADTAHPASYRMLREQAARQPAAFWGPLARDLLVWDTPYQTVWDCDFSSGKIGWFLGGQLNVSGEWAAGILGVPNSFVQRRLTEPSRRSGPGRSLAGGPSPPDPSGSSFPVRCSPAPDPTFPALAGACGDPARCTTWSPSCCWPCPSFLLQWRTLKCNLGVPPPSGAQTNGKQETLRPGWGGGCPARRSRDFPTPVPRGLRQTEKHQAVATAACQATGLGRNVNNPGCGVWPWSRKPKACSWNHLSACSRQRQNEGRKEWGDPSQPLSHPPK